MEMLTLAIAIALYALASIGSNNTVKESQTEDL